MAATNVAPGAVVTVGGIVVAAVAVVVDDAVDAAVDAAEAELAVLVALTELQGIVVVAVPALFLPRTDFTEGARAETGRRDVAVFWAFDVRPITAAAAVGDGIGAAEISRDAALEGDAARVTKISGAAAAVSFGVALEAAEMSDVTAVSCVVGGRAVGGAEGVNNVSMAFLRNSSQVCQIWFTKQTYNNKIRKGRNGEPK